MQDHQGKGTIKKLSPWNPIDYLRLLWWVLVTPQQLILHREIYGERADRNVSAWLISTATFSPAIIPAMASCLGWLPNLRGNLPSSYGFWSCGAVLVLWILMGWWGKRSARFIPSGFSILSASYAANTVVSSVVASRLTGALAGLLMAFVGITIDHYLIRGVEKSLRTGSPSKLVHRATSALLVVDVILFWFSFLGGWRILV
jgi:hypothetical protein